MLELQTRHHAKVPRPSLTRIDVTRHQNLNCATFPGIEFLFAETKMHYGLPVNNLAQTAPTFRKHKEKQPKPPNERSCHLCLHDHWAILQIKQG